MWVQGLKLSDCPSINAKLDEHCEHILVHTGQNYDYELNEIFDDLEIRKPDFFLNSAGLSGAETIGNVIIAVDRVLAEVEPEASSSWRHKQLHGRDTCKKAKNTYFSYGSRKSLL